ncbi:MAG: hypothetical protein MK208_17705 [Shimia sp.]|jgi:hypothetical protein|uniref:hypothetical protein n=1 Tax=Shimia sp. TaxID=1954381 RepID=UPI0025EC6040|nr:hypothetical protein [Shimia sp.]MCH2069076.1 hypothetical protein [Shimia sp.]
MIKSSLLSVAFILATNATVQAQTNLRTQFNQALALFNEMVMNKEIGEAIDMIQPDVVLSDAEKAEYNSALTEAFPDPFVGSATVQSETLKSGFRQEMLAYWTEEGDYLYLYLVMHTQGAQQQVIHVEHTTTFSKFISRF